MTRWKRISLRTAFVLLTLLCIVLGIHATRWHAANEQRRIVAKIRGAQNDVVYDYELTAKGAYAIPTRSGSQREWDWENNLQDAQRNDPAGNRYPIVRLLYATLGVDYFNSVQGVMIGRSDVVGIPKWGRESIGFTREELVIRDTTNAALLQELPRLKHVKILALDWVPPEALASLKNMRSLRHVIFNEAVDKRHLQHIAESFVEVVELNGHINDQQAIAIGKATAIRELRMPLSTQQTPPNFTDAGVRAICDLSNLQMLALNSDYVTEASASELARLKNLSELQLRLPRLSQGLPTAISGKPLKSLYLHHMRVDDATFAAIGTLKELETLSIHGQPIPGFFIFPTATPEMFAEFAKLEAELSPYQYSSPNLSTAMLENLCKLKKLRRLRLDGFVMDAAQVQTLLHNVPLKFLVVANRFTATDKRSLAIEFPHIEIWADSEHRHHCGCDAQLKTP